MNVLAERIVKMYSLAVCCARHLLNHHEALLRGDIALETKATLKVVRTRVEHVLIIIFIDRECYPFSSIPWTQVANFISKGTVFCSYEPATA